jgi:hypothetical protein
MTTVGKQRHYGYTDGVPKRDDETVISIRFPNALAAELRELAREETRSINGTVNEAVKRYVRQQRARRTSRETTDGR